MDKWAMNVIEQTGYVGVFLLMLVENVFPPIPSEVILPLAGYMCAKGAFHPVALFVSATLGSSLGAFFWYWLAAKLGVEKLKDLAEKKGRWFALSPEEVDKSLHWFKKHGVGSTLFGRCIPGVRSLISVPAGLNKMSLWKFSILTVVGTAIWSAFLLWIGYALGNQYEAAGEWLGRIGNIVFIVVGALYVFRVVRGKNQSTVPTR